MTRQRTGFSHRDSYPRVWMTLDSVVSEKFDKMTWRFGWTPRAWKFSNKFGLAFSSWNQMWEGTRGLEEVDPDPWKGFQARVDLHCLGAITQYTCEREREREKTQNMLRIGKKRNNVCMKNAWTCDVYKLKASWEKSNPILIELTLTIKQTLLKCMKYRYNARNMQCMSMW